MSFKIPNAMPVVPNLPNMPNMPNMPTIQLENFRANVETFVSNPVAAIDGQIDSMEWFDKVEDDSTAIKAVYDVLDVMKFKFLGTSKRIFVFWGALIYLTLSAIAGLGFAKLAGKTVPLLVSFIVLTDMLLLFMSFRMLKVVSTCEPIFNSFVDYTIENMTRQHFDMQPLVQIHLGGEINHMTNIPHKWYFLPNFANRAQMVLIAAIYSCVGTSLGFWVYTQYCFLSHSVCSQSEQLSVAYCTQLTFWCGPITAVSITIQDFLFMILNRSLDNRKRQFLSSNFFKNAMWSNVIGLHLRQSKHKRPNQPVLDQRDYLTEFQEHFVSNSENLDTNMLRRDIYILQHNYKLVNSCLGLWFSAYALLSAVEFFIATIVMLFIVSSNNANQSAVATNRTLTYLELIMVCNLFRLLFLMRFLLKHNGFNESLAKFLTSTAFLLSGDKEAEINDIVQALDGIDLMIYLFGIGFTRESFLAFSSSILLFWAGQLGFFASSMRR